MPAADPNRYVIFDLDETLVRSKIVRAAFARVAAPYGIDAETLHRVLDANPGRPSRAIFQALGLDSEGALKADEEFLRVLDELNQDLPSVAYPDADSTLRALAAQGSTLILSTGSSPQRARRVLDEEAWDVFATVIASPRGSRKDAAHYDRMSAEVDDPSWTLQAATVGDSPEDMRLGAQHNVPVRIGIDRAGKPERLIEAGATHVVNSLAAILPILGAA